MIGRRLAVLAGLWAACAGCMHQQVRSQKSDDADREVEMRTVGDLTAVGNASPIPLIGVGIVTGLPGSGGGVPPGAERAQLENELKKLEVSNINELFTSKATSLVRVSATIPPGAKKGEMVDVFVTVPEFCKTSSLRGGKLEIAYLYSFENSQNLSADPTRPDRLLRGHAMMKAEGPVLAGITFGDDEPSSRVGKVWAGGKVLLPDRPFVLEVTPPSVKTSVAIAARVNETFHGPGSSAAPIAVAKNDSTVVLSVPGPYRLNLGRFLRVVRLIPLEGAPKTDHAYVKKINDQLLDPERCITAALRLEALGNQSIPALKLGLLSENEMVRFAAAESLAYLGSPACAEELARQTETHPFVQAYALTALASLNEAVCRSKLCELLNANSPEVRYGAFRALRAFDDRDPFVQGEKLGPTFSIYRVAPESAAQVHASTGKKAEIVLYGQSPRLTAPCSLLAGPEFVVTAREGESRCVVSRFSPRTGKQSKECELDVAEVLKAVVELGGTYVDVLELLRAADGVRAMNCAVKFDALPKAPTVQDLLAHGRPSRPARGESDPHQLAPGLYDDAAAAKSSLAAANR